MKRLIFVLILIVAAGVGLGFYRGWFNIASDRAGGTSNIRLSVDRDKFQEDRKAAVEKVEHVEQQAKDKIAGPTEKGKN